MSRFDYFNIEIYTWNIKTFVSAFIPVKLLKWPPVHINFVVIHICKININSFHVVFQYLLPDHIHDDVIKHQTNLHETSRIIVTYILLFQRIKNWMTFQCNFFYECKNSLPNGGNFIFRFFLLDLWQSFNLDKRLLMDIQCDLNP